jgi:hypothetical protein
VEKRGQPRNALLAEAAPPHEGVSPMGGLARSQEEPGAGAGAGAGAEKGQVGAEQREWLHFRLLLLLLLLPLPFQPLNGRGGGVGGRGRLHPHHSARGEDRAQRQQVRLCQPPSHAAQASAPSSPCTARASLRGRGRGRGRGNNALHVACRRPSCAAAPARPCNGPPAALLAYSPPLAPLSQEQPAVLVHITKAYHPSSSSSAPSARGRGRLLCSDPNLRLAAPPQPSLLLCPQPGHAWTI